MVRFGIIGFGLHAVKRMIPGFQQARNSQLVALTRRDIAKARESAAQYDIPLAFDSCEELCRSEAVDAVFVATPNVCHLSDVLTAVNCGKPVLCEKPMATNAGECRRMVQAARDKNIKLGVAQVFRFEDTVQYARECVSRGGLGRVVLARAEFCYPGRKHPRTWLSQRSMGAGTIADVGVHCIDALRHILNDEVVRLQAKIVSDADSGDVDAGGAIILEFKRGTLATVMVSMRAAYETPLELVGENGVLTAENAFSVDNDVRVVVRRNGNTEEREFLNRAAYARMLDAFAAWTEGKAEFPAPGEEGWRNQIIVDAAYESARTGNALILC